MKDFEVFGLAEGGAVSAGRPLTAAEVEWLAWAGSLDERMARDHLDSGF